MAAAHTPEDLIAWQRAKSLCLAVYRASTKLPSDEKFGLQAQLRRAAVSIPSNIAEGFGRQSTSDMLRFLRVARGSLFEVKTQLIIAVELGYLTQDQLPSDVLDESDRVLQGLIRSIDHH